MAAQAEPRRSPFRPSALARLQRARDDSHVPRFGRHWRLRRRAVPVVLQMSTAECGAACLAMILGYHGRPTRLEECREACGVNRDGMSTRVLVEVARRFGLRARGFSVEPRGLLSLELPAIAHWNFNHFVVIERITSSYADIVDPATGRQRITHAELDAAFTGIVLTFEPALEFSPSTAQPTHVGRTAARYLLRAPGVRSAVVEILLASVLLQVLGLALPVLTGVTVDRVVASGSGSSDLMAILALGILAIVAGVAGLSYLRATVLVYLRARLDASMMLGFFEHLLSLPYRFFEGRKTGQLVSRLSSNAVLRDTLTNQTLAAVLDGALVIGYLGVLLFAAPVFGLVVLAIATVQIGVIWLTAGPLQRLAARELAAYAESQGYLVEALKGIALLKASGSEPRVLAQWSNLFSAQLNLATQRGGLLTIVDATMSAVRVGAPLVLLWFGALRVIDGSLSLGAMLALSALAAAALMPLSSLLSNAQQFQLVSAHLQRVADVLESEPEQRAAGVTPRLSGRIELCNVSFRYAPTAPLALNDISLTIDPGQKVALVGRSGSGKSSLAALLLGLYAPTGGEILYDDQPLNGLALQSLRTQFGVVLQDPFLFSTTIRQNIAFQEPEMALEDVIAAARVAAIHEEIAQMPLGYDTILAEAGATLSGGQRQRLQLARAIARHPKVLLLDEATSHLDVLTEREVDANLSQLACTRIVIAHRLSTIENADQILVFKEGKIVERGTHAELLADNGHYAELVRSQVRAEMVA